MRWVGGWGGRRKEKGEVGWCLGGSGAVGGWFAGGVDVVKGDEGDMGRVKGKGVFDGDFFYKKISRVFY